MELSETAIQLRPQQIELLEKLAVVYEKFGDQPAMAKVRALLIVSDELELTFEQIMGLLSLSKGATSQAINGLLLLKRIDYRTHLGDRKRYFFSRIISWQDEITDTVERYTDYIHVHQQILSQRSPETVQFNESIEEMIQFLVNLTNELPLMLNRLKSQNS